MLGLLTKAFPLANKVAKWAGGAIFGGALANMGYNLMTDAPTEIRDDVVDESGNVVPLHKPMDDDTFKLNTGAAAGFNPVEMALRIKRTDIERDMKGLQSNMDLLPIGGVREEYVQNFNQKLEWLCRANSVAFETQDFRAGDISEFAKFAQQYGIDKEKAFDFYYEKNKNVINKLAQTGKMNPYEAFVDYWGKVASVNTWRERADWASGGLAVAGMLAPLGAVTAPLAPVLLGAAGALAAGASISRAIDYSTIDQQSMMREVLTIPLTASGLFGKQAKGVIKTEGQYKYLNDNLKSAIDGAWDRTSRDNSFGIDRLSTVINTVKNDTSFGTNMFQRTANILGKSFADYGKEMSDINTLFLSFKDNRDMANLFSQIANAPDVMKIVYGLEKGGINPYLDIMRKAASGAPMTQAEETAALVAELLAKRKMSRDLMSFHSWNKEREMTGKLQFKTGNQTAIDGGDIDIPKLVQDKVAFNQFFDEWKQNMLNPTAEGKNVTHSVFHVEAKGTNTTPNSRVFSYEFPYTNLDSNRVVIMGTNSKGENFTKTARSEAVGDVINEMRTRHGADFRIKGVFEGSNDRGNILQQLKTAGSKSEADVEKWANELLENGAPAYNEWVRELGNKTATIRGDNVAKMRQLSARTMEQLRQDEEAQRRLFNSSMYGSFLGDNVRMLKQLDHVIGILPEEQLNGSLTGMIKKNIDALTKPELMRSDDIQSTLKSLWVFGNGWLVVGNHLQSMFSGYLNAVSRFGMKGGTDWLKSYGNAIMNTNHVSAIKEGIKEANVLATSDKNAFNTIKRYFYAMSPFDEIERTTAKNMLNIRPDYSTAWGFDLGKTAMDKAWLDMEVKSIAESNQYMSILQKPFIELKEPKMVETWSSFYRYMVRPTATLWNALTAETDVAGKAVKLGVIPALLGIGAWGTLFGQKITPLGIVTGNMSAGSKYLGELMGSEGWTWTDLMAGLGEMTKNGLDPHRTMPIVDTLCDMMFTDILGQGQGMFGTAIAATGANQPSIATLGFDPSLPKGSPLIELMMSAAQNMSNIYNAKRALAGGDEREKEIMTASITKSFLDVIGIAQRVHEIQKYAGGYGVDVRDPFQQVVNGIFPEKKYPNVGKQSVSISTNRIDKMASMVQKPNEATEIIFRSFQKDEQSRKTFEANSDVLLMGINQKIVKADAQGGIKGKDDKETLLKTASMIVAWRNVMDDKDTRDGASTLVDFLHGHNIENTLPYERMYHSVIEQAKYQKNKFKIKSGEAI